MSKKTATAGSTPRKSRASGPPIDAYASARAAKLDQQTPKWPELRVTINAGHSTVTASGITHDLTSDDPQSEAVTFAAEQARSNGKPIRMTATMAAGDVHRMIITPQRSVVLLDHARPPSATPNNPTAAAGSRKTKVKKNGGSPPKTSSILSRFPPRLQPVIKWGAPALVVLLVVLLTAAILKGHKQPAGAGSVAAQDHPVPGAGTLYTVTAPPGWSQTATWTVALADQSTPYTDPDTGVTAALTPDDRTTAQTAHDTQANIAGHKANYLSVLSPDGSTRFTEPLTTTPVYGPVITTVDGAKVVLLQESSSTVSYWPIAGGQVTNVVLPDGVSGQLNTTGPSVMVPLSDQRVAYLHHGTFQTMEALPLTTPMFANDGSVISTQPETGAWWSQQIDASPTSIRPTPPAGVTAIDQILAITPQHAIISWKSTPPAGSYSAPDVVAAYDVTTGKLIAQATSANTLSPATAVYYSTAHQLTAANGFVLSTPAGQRAVLTLINGLQVDAVYDQVYGQTQGNPVTINAAGKATALPASTLTPTGIAPDHLMVLSQDQLYALPAGPPSTALPLPTPTFVLTTPAPAAAVQPTAASALAVQPTPRPTPSAKVPTPTTPKAAAPTTKPKPSPAKTHRATTAPATTGTKT